MQAKVPKFLDVEDRVVGPLTWRQFAYLAFGLSFGFLAFSQFKSYIGVPIGGGLVALSVALAFVKVNGRPFATFLYSLWQYQTNAHRYFWKQERPEIKIEPLPERRRREELRARTKTKTRPVFHPQTLKRVAEALDVHEPPAKKADRQRKKLEEEVPGILIQNFRQEKEGSKAALLFPDLR